jgi:hypothetical protein
MLKALGGTAISRFESVDVQSANRPFEVILHLSEYGVYQDLRSKESGSFFATLNCL